MKSKLKKIFGVSISAVALLAGIIASTFFLSSPAQGKSNSLISKVIGYGVYDCYQSTVGMVGDVPMQKYDGIDSITSIGHLVKLPYGYYGDLTNTTCANLIGGVPDEGFPGAAALKGVTIPSNNKNTAVVSEFMINMGYTEKKGEQEGLCAQYQYTYTDSGYNITYVTTMCNTTDKDGRITGDRFQIFIDDGSSPDAYTSTLVQFEVKNRAIQLDCSPFVGYGGCSKHEFVPGETKFDTFAGEILGDLQEHRASVGKWVLSGMEIEPYGNRTSTFSLDNAAAAGKKAVEFLTGYDSISDLKLNDSEKLELLKDYLTDWYKVDNYGCNLDSSARNIATGAGYKPIRTNIFSGNEYQTCYIKPTAHVGFSVASYGDSGYFDSMMGFDEIIKNIESLTNSFIEADRQKCNEAATSARQAAQNLLDQSTTSEEYRQRAQNTIDSIDQIKNSYGEYWYESGGNIGCYKFVGLDGQIVDTEITPPSQDNDFDPPVEDATDVCGSEVNGLGWILCPVVNLLSKTVTSIYDNYIQENFLEVKAEWLDTEAPLYKNGWAKFRDYANIAFAILLVIVILSQVTGIGITNYGIKKMLPRLIVVVVMINLSFFICQLAVDISNVVGYALNDLLSGMGVSFRTSAEGTTLPSADGTGMLNTLSIGGLGLAVGTIGSWIVPLALSLITALISVVFAGIILGVRQAGVLILVVISPLAIACYALDGTKPLFDKWRKLFTNLLMVFPICGLLMGGGIFASGVLGGVSGASIFLKLVSALLVVVPFFFIPTVVKGALAAVGNIGAKLSMIGRGARGSAMRVAKGSNAYQQLDSMAGATHGRAMRGLRAGASNIIRKIPGGDKLADRVGRFGNRRIAQYAQKEYDYTKRMAAANAIADSGFMTAGRRQGIEKAFSDQEEGHGIDEQMALLRAEMGSDGVGNYTSLSEALQKASAEYDQKPTDVTLRRKVKALTKYLLDLDDGRGELMKAAQSAFSSNPTSATAQALNDFLQRPENMGIIKQSGQRGLQALLQDRATGKPIGSLAHYAAAKPDKTDPNSVGRLDTSMLKAQINTLQQAQGNSLMATSISDVDKDGNSDLANFEAWKALYDNAMNNDLTKKNINAENLDLMNKMISELSKFKNNQGVNIPH